MDERQSEASIPTKSPESSRYSGWVSSGKRILLSGVASGLAIAVVVGFHFGAPLFAIKIFSSLSVSVVNILLMILTGFVCVVLIPIGGTALILGIIESKLNRNSNHSVKRWPWLFSIPSVMGLLLIPISSFEIFVNVLQPPDFILQSHQLGWHSWIIAISMMIILFSEFETGIIQWPRFSANSELHPNNSEIGTNQSSVVPDSFSTDERLMIDSLYDWQLSPSLGFEDVGGMNNVKNEIQRRVITPLRNRSRAYDRFRVSAPTGILLYGPPGTGKSHLARAIAGELGVPFVELSQADLSSKWINESPMKIRDLFEEAEQFDFCVIFIDEIDGLVSERGSSGHNEDSKVVSEFLARLGEGSTNYLIIAATNRPDQLDSALLRPGRFDDQFEIGLPGTRDRVEMFKVQLRDRRPALSDPDYTKLSQLSQGFSAADITAVVERAALRAAERDARHITFEDLATSIE